MKTIALTSVLLLIGLSAGEARADGRDHIHDLAESLQAQSAAAAREIYYHLRGAPDFVHLYQDSLALYRQSEQLHGMVDAGSSVQQLDEQIHRMDDTQKHIAELVEEMERKNVAPVQGFGHGHVHFAPPVSQFHLERVCDMVTRMRATLDHMHKDITALQGAGPGVILPPPGGQQFVPAVPAPPGPGFPQSQRNIQFRKGNVAFSLRVR